MPAIDYARCLKNVNMELQREGERKMTKKEISAIADEVVKIYFNENVSVKEAIEIAKRKGENLGLSQRRWIRRSNKFS